MGSKSMRGIAWVKNIWRGRQLDIDLDDELRAYVAQLTDEYRARGYEPDEALRAARIEAGAIESIKDQVRDARSGASIETLWQDIQSGTPRAAHGSCDCAQIGVMPRMTRDHTVPIIRSLLA
jgi:hypothetical protein